MIPKLRVLRFEEAEITFEEAEIIYIKRPEEKKAADNVVMEVSFETQLQLTEAELCTEHTWTQNLFKATIKENDRKFIQQCTDAKEIGVRLNNYT